MEKVMVRLVLWLFLLQQLKLICIFLELLPLFKEEHHHWEQNGHQS